MSSIYFLLQGYLRAVEATRGISSITSGFFDSLDVHALSLSSILDQSRVVQNSQLLEFEKKFEVTDLLFHIQYEGIKVTCYDVFLPILFYILIRVGVHGQ
jgi:hypothetical protein